MKQEHRNTGTQEHRNTGTQEHRNTGTLKKCKDSLLLFLLLLTISFPLDLLSQDFCSTPSISSIVEVNQQLVNDNFSNSISPDTFKVYFHVIRRSNKTGGFMPYEVNKSFEILQDGFNDSDIYFAWDGCIDYIDNDLYYTSSNSSTLNAIFNINNHSDGIDIYLYDRNHPDSGGRANDVGAFSELWVAGYWPGYGVSALSPIITHEMGHVFSLFHTHHGCETGNWELTDTSNCSTHGDFICDTPADPDMDFKVDENCEWEGTNSFFCNGAPEPIGNYSPDPLNIMAYTKLNCMDYFSEGQKMRMHNAINSLPHLQNAITTEQITLDFCICESNDLVFSESKVIIEPLKVSGNIRLINGAALTLESSIEFSMDKKLIIEDGAILVLRGPSATLKNCPSVEKWGGVEVQNGGSLKIDEGYIYSGYLAIHAMSGSSVNISNLVAIGNGTSENGETGLWLDGNVSVEKLKSIKILNYQTGIKSNDNAGYVFDQGEISDCSVGASFYKSSSTIKDFNIVAKNVAITCKESPGMLIENNYLNAFVEENDYSLPYFSYTRGIDMNYCDGSIIRNNDIGTSYRSPFIGINLFNSVGGVIDNGNKIYGNNIGIYGLNTDFSIKSNEITVQPYFTRSSYIQSKGGIELVNGGTNQIINNYIDVNGGTFGISTRLCDGNQIENNDIQTYFGFGNNSNVLNAAAILSQGSNNQDIRNNIVNNNSQMNGILATNTSGNTYDCNDVSVQGNKDGMIVYYNSLGQDVRGNTLSSSSNQDLTIRSIIGEQIHEGNKFIGGNTLAEDQDIANDSKFFVNSTKPYHMPTNPNPDDGWFEPEDWVENHYDCVNSPGPNWTPFWDDEELLCKHYAAVKDSFGLDSKVYLRLIQSILRYDAQRENYSLPVCIKNDPDIPNCWKNLILIEQALRAIDTSRVNESAALNFMIDSLSISYSDTLIQDYFTRNEEMIASHIGNLSNERNADEGKLIEIKKELNSITCSDSIMDVALPILKAYVDHQLDNDTTSIAYNELINFSRLCADEYGAYIHLARGIVHPVTDEYFASNDGCLENNAKPRSVKSSVPLTSTVYPNPSTGHTVVNLGLKGSGDITVTDITGKLLHQYKFNEVRNVTLDLSEYSGINFIKVQYEDGKTDVHKQLIIK